MPSSSRARQSAGKARVEKEASGLEEDGWLEGVQDEPAAVRLDAVTLLVLDEADRLLDLGFEEDIKQLLKLIGACGTSDGSAEYVRKPPLWVRAFPTSLITDAPQPLLQSSSVLMCAIAPGAHVLRHLGEADASAGQCCSVRPRGAHLCWRRGAERGRDDNSACGGFARERSSKASAAVHLAEGVWVQ